MPYKVYVTTENNKKVIEELKDLRELINYLWLAENAGAKDIEVHTLKRSNNETKKEC